VSRDLIDEIPAKLEGLDPQVLYRQLKSYLSAGDYADAQHKL
jgi:hypothetical protein